MLRIPVKIVRNNAAAAPEIATAIQGTAVL
jgi:hypothetical protein